LKDKSNQKGGLASLKATLYMDAITRQPSLQMGRTDSLYICKCKGCC